MTKIIEEHIEGQFVAIWLVGVKPFSATLKNEHSQLWCYDPLNDIWWPECDHGISLNWLKFRNAKFFKENR